MKTFCGWTCHNHFEIVHSEVRRGYEVELAFAPEENAPDWEIDSTAMEELTKDIESGKLLWFVARVRAKDQGRVLAEEYLGGCCYASVEDFLTPGGYYEDMVKGVLTLP